MLSSPLFAVLGRLHPMVLHMPVGILVALVVMEVVSRVRGKPMAREARLALVWMAAGFAVVSVTTGLLLSRESAYTHDGVQLHQWLGIATGVLALACAVCASVRVPAWMYGVTLALAAGVMIPAGHFGAGLTHGSNFVFEPLESKTKPARGAGSAGGGAVAGADPFEGLDPKVAKIFRASCAGCHNEAKLKGGLALDSLQGLRNGGDGGAVVVPGNPGRSEVMIRLTLTPGDKEHMPPPGKTPLTAEEVEVIRKWIEGGAKGMGKTP